MVKVRDSNALTTKTIRYAPGELKCIVQGYHDQRDYRYKILPINAIKLVRGLRLNCKRRRHRYTALNEKGHQT